MSKRTDEALMRRMESQNVKVCNCAGCHKLLLAQSSARMLVANVKRSDARQNRLAGYPPTVAGRIDDRPYCADCLGTQEGES